MNIKKLVSNFDYWNSKAPNDATACLLFNGKVYDWIKWIHDVEYNFKHGTWVTQSRAWSLSEYLDYGTTCGYSFHQKPKQLTCKEQLYKLNKKLDHVHSKQLILQRKEVALLHEILNHQVNK